MNARVQVRIPATTANLGPGFDALGLALDLWNETEFCWTGDESSTVVSVLGEGQNCLPGDESNLVARAALAYFEHANLPQPRGLKITCRNAIPTGSGLGSSGSAVLAGLLGASALLGSRLDPMEILPLAVEIEGHADNAAAALLGGLVVVIKDQENFITRRFDVPTISVTIVLPTVDLPTQVARAALPGSVPLGDAVFNLGRTSLVVEALRTGDLDLLGQVMDDRLHQPYRLKLIPGAAEAFQAARAAGAAAVCLSGAGPSIAAYGGEPSFVAAAMAAAFERAGISSRTHLLKTTNLAAQVTTQALNAPCGQ